jgi:hypothetical protein
VLFHTTYSEYFKENIHMFDALDFLSELTQHIPPKRLQLIRRYGLYASRTKGRWAEMPWVAERAPEGWKTAHQHQAGGEDLGYEPLSDEDEAIDDSARCPRLGPSCGESLRGRSDGMSRVRRGDEPDHFSLGDSGRVKVIAVIEDPDELKRILRHLVKIGWFPPGFDPDRPG